MEKIALPAKVRSTRGKGAARKLRRDGILPAVLYGGKEKKSVSLAVDEREFREIFRHHGGKNVLINLQVEGEKKAHSVLVQEMQTHPYKDIIRHLDFLEIAMDKKICVEVTLNFQGVPVGGANLETHYRSIEVECLPNNIPEEIVVDVSALEAGQTIHSSDLSLPEGVALVSEEDNVLAAAVEKAEAEVEAVVEEGEAAGETEESSQE